MAALATADTTLYVAGVEGGATHSKMVICDGDGNVVALSKGGSTNHWAIGIPEVAKRIDAMARDAKAQAQIPQDCRLQAMGLCLSGAEETVTNQELQNYLTTHYPTIADRYVVCGDSIGSMHTVSSTGGMVIIAGTGSNTLLKNPDGSMHGCGGWGHMLGDEGSAWWISHNAIKTVFDNEDNLKRSKLPVDRVWTLIKAHFQVETRNEMLAHCYAKFSKSDYAGLCARLAKCAREESDPLCRKLFKDAGQALARFVCALSSKISPQLVDQTGELDITCVGSVWLSWDLLMDGFTEELDRSRFQHNVRLLKLKKTMAVGATYLAADHFQLNLPRDYSENYEVFYRHRATLNGSSINNGTTEHTNGN